MSIDLRPYLDDIESRLNPEQETRVWDDWSRWARHENTEGPFVAKPRAKNVSTLDWPHVNINDTITDIDLGIYRELETVNAMLAQGSSFILRVRCNLGVGNIATRFGCQPFIMPRETDTQPNVVALKEDDVRRLVEDEMPPRLAGNFSTIARFNERYGVLRDQYPNIRRFVHVEQPDLQGPLDNLELIMGSSPLFLALYDDEELVHALLERVTTAFEQAMDDHLAAYPENNALANYFYHVETGGICIRDDSAMNLSADMYGEFIAPYDTRLLKKYGGIVHFCGRGDHYIDQLKSLEGLRGVNMSQPHLNDMDRILSATVDQGIHLGVTAPLFDWSGHDARNLVFLPY